ncbi:46084_t:CDS:2, partial [Gigaspora margarita]
ELYTAICVLEKVNNEQDLLVFTDRKSIFKHVRGHSGIYKNEQADRLAYLGSQKTDVKEFNFSIRKQTEIEPNQRYNQRLQSMIAINDVITNVIDDYIINDIID